MPSGQQARFSVPEPSGPRDRLSALLRPVLVLPHALLVGGPFLGIGFWAYRAGALGLLAGTITLLDWVAILFTGRPLAGLQGLKHLYLRWRARVLAYALFLTDAYPPFGDGDYPATLEIPEQPATRDRFSVALRPLLLLPHVLVLVALLLGAFLAAIVAWVSLSVAGTVDGRIWRFSRDVAAYLMRVETYALLVHDDYPPFALAVYDTLAPASASR